MSRTFAYLRVSTPEQTTDNQLDEIRAAGFAVQPRRAVAETVSGSVAAMERRGFTRLVDRMEEGDVLVVTKLDRLGRNAMDVAATVRALAALGVRVHCLALGGVDLTSSTGKLTMGVINTVAEFERDLLVERTQAGLRRAGRGQAHRSSHEPHLGPARRGRPAPPGGREHLGGGPRPSAPRARPWRACAMALKSEPLGTDPARSAADRWLRGDEQSGGVTEGRGKETVPSQAPTAQRPPRALRSSSPQVMKEQRFQN